jgi:hypothetical protein
MFFNGFTLLMMIFAGGSAYLVGNHYGYRRGEVAMYRKCRSADAARREFLSNLG